MARGFQAAWTGTLATNGAIVLCGLATGILAARLLAPEGRGALATVLFWPQLITSLGLLSIPGALIYRRGQPDADREAVAASAAALSLMIAAICAIVGYLVLPIVLRDHGAEGLAQIYLLAFVPFNFLALVLGALDQSDMRFGRYNLVRLVPSTVYLAGLLALWGAGAVSVLTVVWANWLGTFITAVVRVYQARHALRVWPSLIEGRELLTFGLRFHGAAVLAVLFAQADRFVVITFWDDVTVGLYVVALTLATAGLNVVSGAFNVLLFPRLAGADGVATQRRIMGQTLRYAMLLLTGGTASLLALCPWLLPFLFGDAYADAVAICALLLLAYLPTALRQIIVQGLRGTGDWQARIVAQTVALATFAVTVWPLVHYLALKGVPLALLIANGVSLSYLFAHLRGRLALPLRECWGLNLETVRRVLHHGHALLRGT